MAAKKLFRAVTVAPAFVEDEVSKFFVDGYDLTHMAATLTGTGNGGGVMVVLVFKLRASAQTATVAEPTRSVPMPQLAQRGGYRR
jgi:hypothetical protein